MKNKQILKDLIEFQLNRTKNEIIKLTLMKDNSNNLDYIFSLTEVIKSREEDIKRLSNIRLNKDDGNYLKCEIEHLLYHKLFNDRDE